MVTSSTSLFIISSHQNVWVEGMSSPREGIGCLHTVNKKVHEGKYIVLAIVDTTMKQRVRISSRIW